MKEVKTRSEMTVSTTLTVGIHLFVLFGFARSGMESSAYGMGQRGELIMEMVALPPKSSPPVAAPAPEMERPPEPVKAESEFKKKEIRKKVKAAVVSQPPTLPSTTPQAVESSAAPSPTATQVSGSVQSGASQISAKPDYLRNPPPRYPAESRRMREEGLATLEVVVSRDGRARDLRIVSSSGFERLDAAALRAVREWRFKPAIVAGIAMESAVQVPIRFALR